MNQAFKGFCGFFRGLYSERDGTPSSARWHAGVVIYFACVWVTYIVIKTCKLPEFVGIALFVGTVAGLTYGANQFASKFANKTDTPQPPTPPTTPPS